MELFLAFSLVFFVFIFFSLCISRALLPVSGAWITVVAEDNGEDLWQRIYALMWLRQLGIFRCPVYILNQGLSPEGLDLLAHLQSRWPQISLYEEGIPPLQEE